MATTAKRMKYSSVTCPLIKIQDHACRRGLVFIGLLGLLKKCCVATFLLNTFREAEFVVALFGIAQPLRCRSSCYSIFHLLLSNRTIKLISFFYEFIFSTIKNRATFSVARPSSIRALCCRMSRSRRLKTRGFANLRHRRVALIEGNSEESFQQASGSPLPNLAIMNSFATCTLLILVQWEAHEFLK